MKIISTTLWIGSVCQGWIYIIKNLGPFRLSQRQIQFEKLKQKDQQFIDDGQKKISDISNEIQSLLEKNGFETEDDLEFKIHTVHMELQSAEEESADLLKALENLEIEKKKSQRSQSRVKMVRQSSVIEIVSKLYRLYEKF